MTYIPSLGGTEHHKFPLQFPSATVAKTSMACTPVLQLSNDGSESVVSHGSGSFWRHKDIVYLITARHVLTGRSPFDDSMISKKGFLPGNLKVFPTVVGNEKRTRSFRMVSVNQESPNWLQDPEFEQLKTDIAAISIGEDPDHSIFCLNDEAEIHKEIFTLVGMECNIVGYPTANFSGAKTPIWRRGSIASEPMLPIDGKPMFLLDASTSPGFSGSPVFRLQFGPLPVKQQDGSLSMKWDNVREMSLVGVYCGRFQHQHVSGEVPFVFYANRIPKLFEKI